MVGMNVGDDEAPDPLRADVGHCRVDRAHRFVGVHSAVEKVDVVAIREQEHVDESVLERYWQAELKHPVGNFVQRVLNHDLGIV